MTLSILVNGRRIFSQPYDPADHQRTARALAEHWDGLLALGPFAVVVADGNVAHLIARGRP